MTRVLGAAQSAAFDKAVISQGLSPDALIESAGALLAKRLQALYPEITKPLVVFCGPGNNGADALVLARHMIPYCPVRIVFPQQDGNGQTLTQLKILKTLLPALLFLDHKNADLRQAGIIVDGLFGTGLNRPLSGEYKNLVHLINDSGLPVVSLDLPSGLGSGFEILNAVKATHTFCVESAKAECYALRSRSYCGTIHVIKGVFDGFALPDSGMMLLDADRALGKAWNAHDYKNRRGHVGIIAGSMGYHGAAVLAAEAALKSGAGLVTLFTSAQTLEAVRARTSSVMVRPFEEEDFFSRLSSYQSVLIGPGLTPGFLDALIIKKILDSQTPLVVDAGCLGDLAAVLPLSVASPVIATPHAAEFEKLCRRALKEYEQDTPALLREFCVSNRLNVLLKSSFSLAAGSDGTLGILDSPNPFLGTGGSGDLLAGACAAFLAQGLQAQQAMEDAGILLSRAAKLFHGVFSSEDILSVLGQALVAGWEDRI